MYREKFTKNLQELVKDKNISQLAKEIGIPQQTLSRYILGQRAIGIENLVKVAKYFGEDLNVLVGLKDY